MPEFRFDDATVLSAILHDSVRHDFPGLVLTPDDFLALEHIAVLEELHGAQAQIAEVWNQLAKWHEARVLRPARLQQRREQLYRTKLGRGSRQRVLKREKPSWQRSGGEAKRFKWRLTRIPPQPALDLDDLRAQLMR